MAVDKNDSVSGSLVLDLAERAQVRIAMDTHIKMLIRARDKFSRETHLYKAMDADINGMKSLMERFK